QPGAEAQREEKPRAREDRARGGERRDGGKVEDRCVDGERGDEGGSRDEDGKEQPAPCMARPQETRRKVEEQRDPPGVLKRTLDVAERRRHIRRVDDERGIRRA